MLTGQQFEEDQAQSIDVGALVDGVSGRRAVGVEGVEMLRGHVGERAADHRPSDLALRRSRSARGGAVEVEQHGRPVGQEQDVGGLEVAVEQAPGMGVVEPLGEPCTDPDGGLHGRRVSEELTGWLVRVVARFRGCRPS